MRTLAGMTTSQLIRKARKAKGMRPADLAAQLGVSRSTVHAWEHGGPGPKLDNLREIATALDVNLVDLIAA